MGYDYTVNKLKKLYEQGEYYLGEWPLHGQMYLEKYDEYVQWITDYEQEWANVEGRFHVLFDFSGKEPYGVPIVKGNYVVGSLLSNGEIKTIWSFFYHLLTAEKIEAIKERKMVSLSCHEETLEKLEKELAALMQRVEDSFGVPPSFFEKN